MGPGSARGDDDPVEVVLLHLLPDALLGVLGARVEVGVREHHVGERGGVLHHTGHVDDAPYVDAAVAHEHTDPRLRSRHVTLGRKLDLGEQGVAGLVDVPTRLGGHPGGHDEVEPLVFYVAPHDVPHHQVLGLRILGDVGDPVGPGDADAELVAGPGDVIVELLAEGPDVHEEDVG